MCVMGVCSQVYYELSRGPRCRKASGLLFFTRMASISAGVKCSTRAMMGSMSLPLEESRLPLSKPDRITPRRYCTENEQRSGCVWSLNKSWGGVVGW